MGEGQNKSHALSYFIKVMVALHSFNRPAAEDAFNAYISAYNPFDSKIALKVEHTYKVAELCDVIARSKGYSSEDVDLAWLCGLLHDIGRFEQLRRWGTFRDSDSMSHAELGLQVLEQEGSGNIARFAENCDWVSIIKPAVGLHSVLDLPGDLDERTRPFCDLVRDADKVDIIRVFASSDCESVLGLSPEDFHRGRISDAAMRGFSERRCLGPEDREADLDGLLGVICLPFELVNPAAADALNRFGYLHELLTSPFGLEPSFSNPDTREKWEKVTQELLDRMR